MIFPASLRKGDRVAMLAPSGPCPPERVPLAVQAVQDMGLECWVMDSCHQRLGYLAGDDRQRASDLHEAFLDPKVKGIFAARGGYGAQRLLPLLDFELIRQSPKVFVGYSDVTALHTVFNQACGFVTFHAPMPVSDLYDRPDMFSLQALMQAVFFRPYQLSNPAAHPPITLVPGRAKGRLTGGNLTLLSSSLGTAYEIDTTDKILFLEETGEEPYKIDRLLLQLKLAGKFQDCAGMVLGRFDPVGLSDIMMAVHDLLLSEDKPILAGLCCGHGLPSITLPLGASVCMDAYARTLKTIA
jgi:muramoyltetrapeptide carboxypeptidase